MIKMKSVSHDHEFTVNGLTFRIGDFAPKNRYKMVKDACIWTTTQNNAAPRGLTARDMLAHVILNSHYNMRKREDLETLVCFVLPIVVDRCTIN